MNGVLTTVVNNKWSLFIAKSIILQDPLIIVRPPGHSYHQSYIYFTVTYTTLLTALFSYLFCLVHYSQSIRQKNRWSKVRIFTYILVHHIIIACCSSRNSGENRAPHVLSIIIMLTICCFKRVRVHRFSGGAFEGDRSFLPRTEGLTWLHRSRPVGIAATICCH